MPNKLGGAPQINHLENGSEHVKGVWPLLDFGPQLIVENILDVSVKLVKVFASVYSYLAVRLYALSLQNFPNLSFLYDLRNLFVHYFWGNDAT